MAHEFVSKPHCSTCAATYARRWRARAGSGVEARALLREETRARLASDPDRYRPWGPLTADLLTGTVYGASMRSIGSRDTNGYTQIDARSTGTGHAVQAHRVVWEAANGTIPEHLEINHRNGIKTDNRLANLELVDRAANVQHSYATGLASNVGERHPRHRLTASAVREIRRAYAEGALMADLAARFGVHRRTINDVVTGRTWEDVSCLS